MSLLLKVTERPEPSPVASDEEHGIYGDVVTCYFTRAPSTPDDALTSDSRIWIGQARMYVREPIKTAQVPGFHECEKIVEFSGTAYLMNENGRTVSSFTAKPSGH